MTLNITLLLTACTTARIKTIKPWESNLEDLGFQEFPGKAEPG